MSRRACQRIVGCCFNKCSDLFVNKPILKPISRRLIRFSVFQNKQGQQKTAAASELDVQSKNLKFTNQSILWWCWRGICLCLFSDVAINDPQTQASVGGTSSHCALFSAIRLTFPVLSGTAVFRCFSSSTSFCFVLVKCRLKTLLGQQMWDFLKSLPLIFWPIRRRADGVFGRERKTASAIGINCSTQTN